MNFLFIFIYTFVLVRCLIDARLVEVFIVNVSALQRAPENKETFRDRFKKYLCLRPNFKY